MNNNILNDYLINNIKDNFYQSIFKQIPEIKENNEKIEEYQSENTLECISYNGDKKCFRDYSKYNNTFNSLVKLDVLDIETLLKETKVFNQILGRYNNNKKYPIIDDYIKQYYTELKSHSNKTNIINKINKEYQDFSKFNNNKVNNDDIEYFTKPEELREWAEKVGGVIKDEMNKIYQKLVDRHINLIEFYKRVNRVIVGELEFKGIETEVSPIFDYSNTQYFTLESVIKKILLNGDSIKDIGTPKHIVAHNLFILTSVIYGDNNPLIYFNYYSPITVRRYYNKIKRLIKKIKEGNNDEDTIFFKTYHMISILKVIELLSLLVNKEKIINLMKCNLEVRYRARILDLLRPYLENDIENNEYTKWEEFYYNLLAKPGIEKIYFRIQINDNYKPVILGIDRIDIVEENDNSYIEIDYKGIPQFLDLMENFLNRRENIKLELLINNSYYVWFKK
jgi:hypothetical protein